MSCSVMNLMETAHNIQMPPRYLHLYLNSTTQIVFALIYMHFALFFWVCREGLEPNLLFYNSTFVSGCGDEEADDSSRGESLRLLASEISLSEDRSWKEREREGREKEDREQKSDKFSLVI